MGVLVVRESYHLGGVYVRVPYVPKAPLGIEVSSFQGKAKERREGRLDARRGDFSDMVWVVCLFGAWGFGAPKPLKSEPQIPNPKP